MLKKFWESLVGKAVKPNLFEDREFVVPDDIEEVESGDAEHGPPIWNDITPISGVPCIIAYTDSKGMPTERLITCQRLDSHKNDIYLRAFCHSRRAVRQFRMSRIDEVSDPSTGETYESVDGFFAQFSLDNTHESQPGWGLSVRRRADFVALLNALVFLARCDKKYHPLERDSLEDFVARYWIRSEATGEPDMGSILRYADKLSPDAEVFWVSLHRCASNSMLKKLLQLSARQMVDADGVISAEETYWGSKLDQFLEVIELA